MTTARRFGGTDAHACGLVHTSSTLEELQTTAASLVHDLAGKDRATLGAIKSTMFAEVVTALRSPE